MRRLRFVVLCLLAVCILAPAWAQIQPCLASPLPAEGGEGGQVSLDEYRQAIDRAYDLVAREEPELAAEMLAAITSVSLPGGETMPVDHVWFVGALRSGEVDLDVVSARLGALLQELETWPPGSVAPDAFEKLEVVLSRPEFQPQQAVDLSPLNEWLRNLFDFLPDLPGIPLWLGDLVLIGGVVVLAAIVAYFAAGLWGSFAAQAELEVEGVEGEPLSAGQALARSREKAGTGDYRSAVRLLYLSTLLLLEERNLLRYDRTLTNREYLRQLDDQQTVAGAFRPVVDTFDEVWYGEVEPDADSYQAYLDQVGRVREVEE